MNERMNEKGEIFVLLKPMKKMNDYVNKFPINEAIDGPIDEWMGGWREKGGHDV